MFNKLGMAVEVNPKEVREELLRGTGSVMADGCSIFLESNVRDQTVVVTRCPEDEPSDLERREFDVKQFGEAWELFLQWKKS